jgi:hypothetical protein
MIRVPPSCGKHYAGAGFLSASSVFAPPMASFFLAAKI